MPPPPPRVPPPPRERHPRVLPPPQGQGVREGREQHQRASQKATNRPKTDRNLSCATKAEEATVRNVGKPARTEPSDPRKPKGRRRSGEGAPPTSPLRVTSLLCAIALGAPLSHEQARDLHKARAGRRTATRCRPPRSTRRQHSHSVWHDTAKVLSFPNTPSTMS